MTSRLSSLQWGVHSRVVSWAVSDVKNVIRGDKHAGLHALFYVCCMMTADKQRLYSVTAVLILARNGPFHYNEKASHSLKLDNLFFDKKREQTLMLDFFY